MVFLFFDVSSIYIDPHSRTLLSYFTNDHNIVVPWNRVKKKKRNVCPLPEGTHRDSHPVVLEGIL